MALFAIQGLEPFTSARVTAASILGSHFESQFPLDTMEASRIALKAKIICFYTVYCHRHGYRDPALPNAWQKHRDTLKELDEPDAWKEFLHIVGCWATELASFNQKALDFKLIMVAEAIQESKALITG